MCLYTNVVKYFSPVRLFSRVCSFNCCCLFSLIHNIIMIVSWLSIIILCVKTNLVFPCLAAVCWYSPLVVQWLV